MFLDPRRNQILCHVKCGQNEVMKTTREFLKFDRDKEGAVIPQTADDCIKQCKEN